MVSICTGMPYWSYIGPMIASARQHFLTNHEVDYFLWSDIPEGTTYGATVFATEAAPWPYPTLMRYHLFLQQEEILKKYDYIFYCDADMLFVDTVDEEILGEGLTGIGHPMYWFRPGLRFPLEPNSDSAAYIPVPRYYFCGGCQGGRSKDFIQAMWKMKRMIDHDLDINYSPIWNDESIWNRYLFDNPPAVILDPSYCYPDSLIKEYYQPLWGQSFKPKLITLTKPFTTSKEGGDAVKAIVNDLEKIKHE